MSFQKAASKASRILDLCWDGRLPVNPKELAENLLVKNYSRKDGEKIPVVVKARSSHLLKGASGLARLAKEDDRWFYVCEFNRDEISYRNRFTIAHELGHVVLGHVTDERSPKRDTTFTNDDPDERFANAFAAALLMPEKFVRKLYRSARGIQELADAFGVSTAAMNFRLKNLGIM
ncbi:MAG: ImmA/IrrE family metallo-endopeptidase [Proteobacteria bacterium]|nr:MAG: ImmA/IrrE family metallo-endopeptidase [Pseudomonadota bacterium]